MAKESFRNLTHFCTSLGIKESQVKKVLMPEWWSEGKRLIGYTDAKDTYCCETRPSWYVWVPAADYDGYFSKGDLKIIPIKRRK